MFSSIKRQWDDNPLPLILGVAIFFRLLSVIFAKGWGMIDDHFIVIESAQSWVDGKDYNSWLPGSPDNTGPTGHNFFYPGLHFLLFYFFKLIHFNDPQAKMLVVRLIHGAWSLVTVFFGYKIAERIGNEKSARIAGLLLALFWFMPWMSVRNLVEIACIPFLILAVWFLVRHENDRGIQSAYFLSGLFLGLAFNLRPQTVFFTTGLGIAILIRGRWKEVFALVAGFAVPIILIQGTIDYMMWGKPFVEIITYFKVNFQDSQSYITLPWYNYFLVIAGVLVPPVSLFITFGFLRTWRRFILIALPVTLFFVLHSAFPNKQERFIFPIIPLLIITGITGWLEFEEHSLFWQMRKKLRKACWIFFWTVNLLLLAGVSMVYSKRARVETMYYLSKYPDIRYILVADSKDSPELFPRFYLGQWPSMYDELKESENTEGMMKRVSALPPDIQPRFVLFTCDGNFPGMVKMTRKYFPFIVYETTIETGVVDKVVHWLNPINKNRPVYVYRNQQFYPRRIE
jgi:hypothetical protein